MLHTKVDLVVTLGGDGTVLWVSKSCYLIHFVKLPLKILVWTKLLYIFLCSGHLFSYILVQNG
jgi:hypothetical protein